MIGTMSILTQNYPIYFIKIITFNQEKIKEYPFLNNLGTYAIFGNLESVILCQIKPKMKFIYTMHRPEYLSDLNNADANIDIGKPIDRGIYDNNSNNIILLVISWGKIVYLHELIIENNEIEEKLIKDIKKRLTDYEEQVFELMLSNFSYREIADILDKNPKAIDNAIQRIRLKVKEALKK